MLARTWRLGALLSAGLAVTGCQSTQPTINYPPPPQPRVMAPPAVPGGPQTVAGWNKNTDAKLPTASAVPVSTGVRPPMPQTTVATPGKLPGLNIAPAQPPVAHTPTPSNIQPAAAVEEPMPTANSAVTPAVFRPVEPTPPPAPNMSASPNSSLTGMAPPSMPALPAAVPTAPSIPSPPSVPSAPAPVAPSMPTAPSMPQ